MSTAAAARQRLYRQREANGKLVLSVEVSEADLCTALVDGGFISTNDQDDREKLQAALSRLIEIVLTADASRVTAGD